MTNIDGLVIRDKNVGESSKSITLLTANGCIDVYVRGGQKSRKSLSSTQLFSYSHFSLDKKKNARFDPDGYFYNSSEPIKLFYNIRLDAKKTALGFYFGDILRFSNGGSECGKAVMRLMLNTLYYLNSGERDEELLKSIFEFRLLSETGFCPALIGCAECYKVEDDEMIFDLRSGRLFCTDCFEFEEGGVYETLDRTMLHIVRHICLVDIERLFNFKISEKYQTRLTDLSEKFIYCHYGKRFDSLKFYRQL